jgi:hypothetical protein
MLGRVVIMMIDVTVVCDASKQAGLVKLVSRSGKKLVETLLSTA